MENLNAYQNYVINLEAIQTSCNDPWECEQIIER